MRTNEKWKNDQKKKKKNGREPITPIRNCGVAVPYCRPYQVSLFLCLLSGPCHPATHSFLHDLPPSPTAYLCVCSAWSGFGFCIFHKLIQVVFPSFGWSSCSPLSPSRHDKRWIPLSRFPGPSVWILGGCPQGISVSLVFQPSLRWCMSALFISFFRASF